MLLACILVVFCITQVPGARLSNDGDTEMIRELLGTNHELIKMFKKMETRMSNLEQENLALKGRVAVLEEENISLTENNGKSGASEYTNSTHARRLVLDEATPVAFLATLAAHRKEEHLGVNQNVLYDTTITNIGGGFNINHGIFTVPRAGIYLISASVLSWIDTEFHASIMVNAKRTVSMFGHGSAGRHEQATQVAVLQLNVGDTVTVENVDLPDVALWGERFTSFTGVLLYPN